MALADLRKGFHGTSCNGFYPQIRSIPELPVLQLDKYHTIVLCSSREADTGNRHAGFHSLFFIVHEMALYLAH